MASRPTTSSLPHVSRPLSGTRPASRVLPGAHKPRMKSPEPVEKILSDTARERQFHLSERRVHGQIVDPVLESELYSLLRRNNTPEAKWTRLATPDSEKWRSPGNSTEYVESSLADLSAASTDIEASMLAETPERRRILLDRARNSNPASRLGKPFAEVCKRAQPENPKDAYRRELDEQIRIKKEMIHSSIGPTKSAPRAGTALSSTPYALNNNVSESNVLRPEPQSIAAPPYALNNAPPRPFSESEMQAEIGVVSRFIKTMHWGESDVSRWYEKEEKMRQYREDLAKQVEEKRARTALAVRQDEHAAAVAIWGGRDGRLPVPQLLREDLHTPAFPSSQSPDILITDCCDASDDVSQILDLCHAQHAYAPEECDGDATPTYGVSPRGAHSDDSGSHWGQHTGVPGSVSVYSEDYYTMMKKMSELQGEVQRQKEMIENLQQKPTLSTRAQARSRPLSAPRTVTAKVVDRKTTSKEAPKRADRKSVSARKL